MKTFGNHLNNALGFYCLLCVLSFAVAYFQHDNVEHIGFRQGAFFINHQKISGISNESWTTIFIIFLALSYKDIKEKLKQYF